MLLQTAAGVKKKRKARRTRASGSGPGICPARLSWPQEMWSEPDWVDAYVLALGIDPVIPSQAKQDLDVRMAAFDRPAYRDRSIVLRLIAWLKESRRILARVEKTAKLREARWKWRSFPGAYDWLPDRGFQDKA